MTKDEASKEVEDLALRFVAGGQPIAAAILYALAGSIIIGTENEMSTVLEDFVEDKLEQTRAMAEILRALQSS